MAQGNQQGGQRQQAQPYTPNERMSLQERLAFVLGQLATRQPELEAVLPPDIPFKMFHATVNQALRNNPDILDCTPVSIVNACVKSAYDGLRLDGKEAALVSHNVKIEERGKPKRYEKRAQYFPMVFGLIQQVLRGGMVVAIEADIIYENDKYRIIRGSAPAIEHEPLFVGDRGKPIGAYSVAVFPSGYRSTLPMRMDEIEDVRKASKSGDKDGEPQGIWKRWWAQMWIKTVIRRHRKTLPVGRDIHDSEADDEFGFSDDTAALAQLPAAAQQRPTRPAEIGFDPLAGGAPLDIDEREGELVEVGGDAEREDAQQQRAAEPEIELPADPAEWQRWHDDIDQRIAAGADTDTVNALWRDERPRLDKAPSDLRDALNGAFSDRIAELATGGDK